MAAILAKQPGAWDMLFDRYGTYVERLIVRVVGFDTEVPDLINEVFARALEGVDHLKDPSSLKAWLGSIAIFTSRVWIRNRGSRRRWMHLFSPHEMPDVPAAIAPPEVSQTLQRIYAVLQELGTDERIAFTLRYIEGMELHEIAENTGVSLSTVKRRLSRADNIFLKRASRDSLLSERLAESARWGSK
ncbi:MAG TPA: RNA polymerase sigma factor [Polyangiaceae bacterium]